jgi:hypothetical protein
MTLHCFADGSIGPANHPSPFDAAWRTRIPSSWSTPSDDQPKRRIGSSDGWDERKAAAPITQERKIVRAATAARQDDAKPFRFEDLNGKPDPEKWGPAYPKTASAAVTKWRSVAAGRELTSDETRAYGQAVHAWINGFKTPKRAPDTLSTRSNCASGQAGEFCAKKHRAALLAKLYRDAEADRRARTDKQIIAAYEAAMMKKRARLEQHDRMVRDIAWFEAAKPVAEAA